MTVPNFLTISPRLGTQIDDVGAKPNQVAGTSIGQKWWRSPAADRR